MAKRMLRSQAVDLVSISQALVVADYLSFRQAASVLGIRSSAVSRRVRSLEDLLGVSLFERHHTGVRVTSAGARFFLEAREVLGQLEHAVRAAGTAGRGAVGRLNVGIWSSIGTGFLRELIGAYSERHPDVTIQILEGASFELVGLVRKRHVDVAFVIGTPEMPDCDVARLWSERLFVVLPQGHRLAAKKEVEWRDLRKEHFIVRRAEPDPGLCKRVTDRLAHRDSAPSVQKLDVGRETLMHLVALGLGLGLTGEAAVATRFAEVEFRPIAGGDDVVQFSAVWSPENDNPALRRFVSMARAMAKRKRKPGNSSQPEFRWAIAQRLKSLGAFLGALVGMRGQLP
jgi:DNA-binding transcriptional LysR family regulator